jgi:nucleotide-binding universal stress UspA family protein
MKFDKILIPLDGSRFAEAALPKAVELVRNNPDSTLILLRAAEATTFPGVDPIDAQVSVVRRRTTSRSWPRGSVRMASLE